MSYPRSKAVLELGARLVEQLEASDDFLASWMAHYIAELIDNVERATADTKLAAQDTCAKAILELWRHRASLGDKVQPFAKLEPIVRTLASLDTERPEGRYYARDLHDAVANADEEARQWLDFASDVDYVARFLIRTALRSAARSAAASVSPWVELARNAELDERVERSVVDFILRADATGDEKQLRAAALRLSLSRIESFLKDGASLAEDLRAHLADENEESEEGDKSEESEEGEESEESDGSHEGRKSEIHTDAENDDDE